MHTNRKQRNMFDRKNILTYTYYICYNLYNLIEDNSKYANDTLEWKDHSWKSIHVKELPYNRARFNIQN